MSRTRRNSASMPVPNEYEKILNRLIAEEE